MEKRTNRCGRQQVMLYEWPILAFLLAIVGLVLASYHPGFLVLVGLGFLVFFRSKDFGADQDKKTHANK